MEGARLLAGGAWAGALVAAAVMWVAWTFWRRGVMELFDLDADDLGSVDDDWTRRYETDRARRPGG